MIILLASGCYSYGDLCDDGIYGVRFGKRTDKLEERRKMGGISKFLTMPLLETQGQILTLVDMLITVAVFLVFYVLARVLSYQLQKRILPRAGITGSARRLINSLVSFTVLLSGVYTALTYIGINLSIMLVPLGAVSIGLGLGLQTLASNYVAGVVILIEKTFKDGDLIDVNGMVGTVIETGLRATVVKTFNNTEVILPNSILISQQLENWTKTDTVIRVDANVGVAYGTNIRQVHGILHHEITSHEAVLEDPEPRTFLTEFADSALNFRFMYYVGEPAHRLSSLSDILEGIYFEFEKQGVEIPFPQRDIWMRSAQQSVIAGGSQPLPIEATQT